MTRSASPATDVDNHAAATRTLDAPSSSCGSASPFAISPIEAVRLNRIASTVPPRCLADYAELATKTRLLKHSFAIAVTSPLTLAHVSVRVLTSDDGCRVVLRSPDDDIEPTVFRQSHLTNAFGERHACG